MITHTLPNSLSLTVESMKDKLGALPLVTQLPLGEGRDFTGVLDLLTFDLLIWQRGTDGSDYVRVPILKVNSETGERDFASISKLVGPSWNFTDLPLSRERVRDALDQRSLLADQVQT